MVEIGPYMQEHGLSSLLAKRRGWGRGHVSHRMTNIGLSGRVDIRRRPRGRIALLLLLLVHFLLNHHRSVRRGPWNLGGMSPRPRPVP
jgi:hypothetical protein